MGYTMVYPNIYNGISSGNWWSTWVHGAHSFQAKPRGLWLHPAVQQPLAKMKPDLDIKYIPLKKSARWLKVAGANSFYWMATFHYLPTCHASPKLRKSSILPGMMQLRFGLKISELDFYRLAGGRWPLQRRRFLWSYVILCGFVLFLVK